MSHTGNPLNKAAEIRCSLDHPNFALDLIVRDPEVLRWRVENDDFFLQEITRKGQVLYETA